MREFCRIMARRSSDSPALPPQAPPFSPPYVPDFVHEAALLAGGANRVAGIDEVGRGPLAGPVVAAAVCLHPDRVPVGLNDSKKLTEKARNRLFHEILESAEVSLGSASPAEIDRINIRQATFLAMRRAIQGLGCQPGHILIDGKDIPDGLPCPATAFIGGDRRIASIAAASIVAKVLRDRLMIELSRAEPEYGFERHMGYGTPQHLAALAAHGPSPHHRLSFAPVRLVSGTHADVRSRNRDWVR